jgi:hypothetical protein
VILLESWFHLGYNSRDNSSAEESKYLTSVCSSAVGSYLGESVPYCTFDDGGVERFELYPYSPVFGGVAECGDCFPTVLSRCLGYRS